MTPNPLLRPTFASRLRRLANAGEIKRVRRAWRVTS